MGGDGGGHSIVGCYIISVLQWMAWVAQSHRGPSSSRGAVMGN